MTISKSTHQLWQILAIVAGIYLIFSGYQNSDPIITAIGVITVVVDAWFLKNI